MTEQDKKKIAELKKFKKAVEKLLQKYPHIFLTCNIDGDLKCYTSIGQGYTSVTLQGYANR